MKCAGWLTLMHPSGTSTIADGAAMVRRASTVMTRRIDSMIDLLGGRLVSVGYRRLFRAQTEFEFQKRSSRVPLLSWVPRYII
jgi:hypothetical protein